MAIHSIVASVVLSGSLALSPLVAGATSVIVPDEIGSVQAAFDSGADSLLIRGGSYPERLIVHRPVTILGIGPMRPWLTGLILYNYGFSESPKTFTVSGVRFTGHVELITSDFRHRNLHIGFGDCVLDSGLTHVRNSDPDDITLLEVTNSHLKGDVSAIATKAYFVADTVDGTIDLFVPEEAQVRECWFRGGAGTALSILGGHSSPRVVIASNTIENYDAGTRLQRNEDYVIASNVIRNIGGRALDVRSGERIDVRDNAITGCTNGLVAYGEYVNVTGNAVREARDIGLWVHASETADVLGNVVVATGGTGLLVEMEPHTEHVTISNNTVVGSAGSAIVAYRSKEREAGTVQAFNNIGTGSGGAGLFVSPGEIVALSCNDWFANALGMTIGVDPGPTDLNVDPLFCNIDGGEVKLFADSPLLDAPGCGLIGALGLGCGATPVLVTRLTADPTEEAIRIEWQWGGLERPTDSWIERANQAAGPWSRIETERSEEDGITVDLDRSALPGIRYFFRLAWIIAGGGFGSSEIVTATISQSRGLSLTVVPNPSHGPVAIVWSLPKAGRADIAVFDVAGREVAGFAQRRYEAGTHTWTWGGLAERGPVAPGLYLVRLRQGDQIISRRFLLRR